jgi:hypothetical protein
MEKEKDIESGEDVAKRIDGMEKELAEKTLALGEALARIAGMENERTRQVEEMAVLKKNGDTVNRDLEMVKGALAEAVKCYRELVIAANRELPAELIGGETVASLNESLTKARGLVGKVRLAIEAESARTRIPVGAPGRQSENTSTLTSREKIARGMGRE